MQVGLRQDDGTRLNKLVDLRRIFARRKICQGNRASRRRHIIGIVVVFYHYRHTVQRAAGTGSPPLLI